jgi:ribonuclease HI
MLSIFTDGSCNINKRDVPNKGAYAFVVINENGVKIKEKVVNEENTTNNRMELSAVIESLSSLKEYKDQIVVYTDSEYVSNAVNLGWLEKWKKNNFLRGKKQLIIPNKDLWEKLIPLLKSNVKFTWIKGHCKENVWNDYVDKLCTESYKKQYIINH